MHPGPREGWRSVSIGCAVVFVLSMLLFVGNLDNEFVFDDGSVVERNERIRSVRGALESFSTPYWGEERNSGLYRPLTLLSYALNHAASGLEPRSYHAVNDLLHAVNAVLVLLVAWRLSRSVGAGWTAGLLFAAHPVHTEAVNWVVGRAELLSTLFVLSALLVAVFPEPAEARIGPLRTAIVVLAALAGILCKENAVVAMPMVLAALFLVGSPKGESAIAFLRRHAMLLAGWAITMSAWFTMRSSAVGDAARPVLFHDNPLAAASVQERIWTSLSVLGLALRRLLVPFGFSVDYSPPKLPVLGSPWSPAVLAAMAVLLAAVVAGYRLRSRQPVVSFWILFFVVAWIPTSNLLFVIGTLFGERLLYLPSVAFCALVGLGLDRLSRRKLFVVAVAGLTLVYAGSTVRRGVDWQDNRTLFGHEVRNRPCSVRSLANYANVLEEEDPERAMEVYAEAVALDPAYGPGRLALGTFLLKRGEVDAAVAHLVRADELTPNDPTVLLNLGSAHARRGELAEAIRCWRTILDRDPEHRRARLNLERAERMLAEQPQPR